MFRDRMILGVNGDGEIVFGDVEINNNNIFSMCFDYVVPFRVTDDYLYERVECYLDGMTCEDKYLLCEDYDVSPSNLVQCLIDNFDVEDYIDCSLCASRITIDDKEYMFEFSSCGQRASELLEIYVNKDAYDTLYSIWKMYHLKEIPETIIEEVKEACKKLFVVDDEDLLKDFVWCVCE